jgi:putative tryptophan/tyrosine transport system substrate-binding protein
MNRPPSPLSMLLSRHTRRREFIAGLGAAVVWPLAVRAQQPAMPVIGFLGSETPDDSVERLRAFRQGLGETGFVEGRNVAIEYRWAEGRNDRLPALATDLVRRRVAVITSVAGIPGAQAAKAATATIPIVFFTGADPVAFGLVASISRPGGNLTGASALLDEVGPKKLELMKELLPGATLMALVVNPSNPVADAQSRDMLVAARAMGLTLHILHSSSKGDLDALFRAAAELGVRALLIGAEQAFARPAWQLAFVALAAQHSIPAVSGNPSFVAAGGLMTYGNNGSEAHHICGVYTGQILKGAKPADLPVQQSTKIELAINMKAAKAIGLAIPPNLLVRADEVIE